MPTVSDQLDQIERDSDGRPTAAVHCPHCGSRMLATDARAHVLTIAAWRRSYGFPETGELSTESAGMLGEDRPLPH